jgi:drug/metabolite transporter (DMT)-like permease
MNAGDWSLLLLLSALWGGSFFFSKVALAELPPLTVALARLGFAAAALLPIACVAGAALPRERRAWRDLAIMGLLNNALPMGLIFWGQTHIASGLAAILNGTTPIFTVVLAHLLTRDERLTPGKACGVGLGFFGVMAMIGPDALAGLGSDVVAQVAVLAAAFSYACAGLFGRRFAGTPPLATASGQLLCSSCLLLPAVAFADAPWQLEPPSLRTWLALAALALISTALAYVIYFRILAAAGATNLLLVTFLIPVTALLLGSGILGEVIAPRQLIGMAIIGAGLAAIDGRPLAHLRLRLRRLAAG